MLLEEGLKAEVVDFTRWSGPESMLLLYHTVSRLVGSMARVLGLTRRTFSKDDEEDEKEEDTVENFDYTAAAQAELRSHCTRP